MPDVQGSTLPLGGAGLTVEQYADFIRAEYLSDYVRDGGAAVRFVVPGNDAVARRWHAALAAAARDEGYVLATIDAAETRVHMVDQVYAAVARQVDWMALADRAVRAAWDDVGLPAPAGNAPTVQAVAATHDVDPREAARTARRALEGSLLHDPGLAREFRTAALRLCQAALDSGDVTPEEHAAILAWLRVEPVALRALRSAALYGRVGRHNARALLHSLSRWHSRATGGGLLVAVDLGRLAVARRPPPEQREGLYYSKAAVLDAYEVLRQFVDGTDQLRGTFVAVTIPPELVTAEARGLPAYTALQLRVVDEVRDRRRPNPYAALVRLETRLEVVS